MTTRLESRASIIHLFRQKATEDGLIKQMHPDRRKEVEEFDDRYQAFTAPSDAMKQYRVQIAPLELVFGNTHRMVKILIDLLEAWSLDDGTEVVVEAASGQWKVGEDEAADLDKLQKFYETFVKSFGHNGLPPGLRREHFDKQVKAHLAARKAFPPEPPKQKYADAQAEQRLLAELCDHVFDVVHDFLDGSFGRTGTKAFLEKSQYGYDRRAGMPPLKPSKKKTDGTGATKAAAPSAGKKKGKKTDSGQQTPPPTPPAPGPTAAGTAGQAPAAPAPGTSPEAPSPAAATPAQNQPQAN